MNANLGQLAHRNRAQSDAFNGLAARARELRTRADALIALEANLKTAPQTDYPEEANLKRRVLEVSEEMVVKRVMGQSRTA